MVYMGEAYWLKAADVYTQADIVYRIRGMQERGMLADAVKIALETEWPHIAGFVLRQATDMRTASVAKSKVYLASFAANIEALREAHSQTEVPEIAPWDWEELAKNNREVRLTDLESTRSRRIVGRNMLELYEVNPAYVEGHAAMVTDAFPDMSEPSVATYATVAALRAHDLMCITARRAYEEGSQPPIMVSA